MKKAMRTIVLFAITASFLTMSGAKDKVPAGESTGLRGPYLGQDPPGGDPKIFAPGVVSTPGNNEFCASFSPDGKEFYFNRGMTVMVCRLEKEGWTAPESAAFNGKYRNHESHLAFDNKRMFFGSSRPPQPYGIWLTERTADGWSEPKRMWDGMYATSSKNGDVYFGVEGPSGAGIVCTRLADGRYTEPVAQAVGFGDANPKSTSIFHPAIAPDESLIFFDDNNGLYVSFREGDGSWGEAVPLGEIHGEQKATIPSISPDGNYLFYASHDDVYWVSTSVLERIRCNGQWTVRAREKRAGADSLVLTVLYNNTSASDSVIADHGFSCLLEMGGHSYLFDAGRVPDKFMANVRGLGVDCSKVKKVIVSHIHDDHMGGIFELLASCVKPALYLPFSYPQSASEPHTDRSDSDYLALLKRLKPSVSKIIQRKDGGEIGEGIYTTGMIEDQSYEQALLVPTTKGLVVLTGCAHPGILEIVKRARELMRQDVYFVMGGFHLTSTDPARVKTIARELRTLTKYIGPCHCTGEKAEAIFKDVFKDDYVDIRAGMKIRLGEGPMTTSRTPCPHGP
ncbi:MAG: MBL fold metallo-hydrolase [Candidatus Aminicenantes bacterium]|nr:MBL fold metallo-hydrolase [Candidatus Aminicenantes bacterium]